MPKTTKLGKINDLFSAQNVFNYLKTKSFFLHIIILIIVSRLCWLENNQWMRIIEWILILIGLWLNNEIDIKRLFSVFEPKNTPETNSSEFVTVDSNNKIDLSNDVDID